jgi:hypothetical protein
MRQEFKQRQRTKRAVEETEVSVETEMSAPTASVSDAAELVALIDELLGG